MRGERVAARREASDQRAFAAQGLLRLRAPNPLVNVQPRLLLRVSFDEVPAQQLHSLLGLKWGVPVAGAIDFQSQRAKRVRLERVLHLLQPRIIEFALRAAPARLALREQVEHAVRDVICARR